jgi:hypothetical protein
MKKLCQWFGELGKDSEPVNYVELAKNKQLEEKKRMAAEVVELREIESEIEGIYAILKILREEDLANLELPEGPYRIKLIEYLNNEEEIVGYSNSNWNNPIYKKKKSGYYVQKYVIVADEYENYKPELSPYYSYTRASTELEKKRVQLKHILGEADVMSTSIQWRNVGSSNPFGTYEEAAAWLKKWIRPEVVETFFDENGDEIKPKRTSRSRRAPRKPADQNQQSSAQ